MSQDKWDWINQQDERMKEERSKEYFDIKEGKQQFVLLSHFAPFAQVFDPATKKYRIAEEGDSGVSIKGLCWVLQDGVIKSAKMPYTVVKAVKALSEDPEWDFKFPFPHTLTLNAEGAGTKEVKYSLTPSPKQFVIEKSVMDELASKPSPEDMVEKLKGKTVTPSSTSYEYPEEELNPSTVGFGDE